MFNVSEDYVSRRAGFYARLLRASSASLMQTRCLGLKRFHFIRCHFLSFDVNVILAAFAGGLDDHQHLSLCLVLPLLRPGGSVFLHASPVGGE